MLSKILFILVFISGFLFRTTAQDKLVNRPNILIIITDDQGYADLSAFHHSAKDIETPNMDRLAEQGTLFSRAYTTAPVCSPSRAGLFTGRYQQRWGGWKFRTGLPEDEKTISEYFKEAGYNTAMIGKSDWGANYHKHNVREYPLNHGYDYFLGFSSHAHDYFLMSGEIEKTTPDPHGHSAALGRLMYNNDYKSYKQGYSTEIFTDEAIRFLEMNKNNEQPFMLTLSYNAVHHLIHEVPEKYLNKYNVESIPNYDPSMGKYSKYYAKYSQYGAIANYSCRNDIKSKQAKFDMKNEIILCQWCRLWDSHKKNLFFYYEVDGMEKTNIYNEQLFSLLKLHVVKAHGRAHKKYMVLTQGNIYLSNICDKKSVSIHDVLVRYDLKEIAQLKKPLQKRIDKERDYFHGSRVLNGCVTSVAQKIRDKVWEKKENDKIK